MNQAHLKKLRVFFALAFFILTALLFFGLVQQVPPATSQAVLYLQFVPSLLHFTDVLGLAAAGFIFVLILTLLFGRVFCSTICPLGTLQDIVIRLADKVKKPRKVRFRYSRPHTLLRYGILSITVVTFLAGGMVVLNLLDPFSNFGRIIADLFRPIFILVNNLGVRILGLFDNYWLYPLEWKVPQWTALFIPLLLLSIVVALSATKGRFYCNTLCPVGTLLGFIAKFAVFKIKIDSTACSLCAKCSIDCKASCIRLKTREIDFSRCVACFNCMTVCENAGIGYRAPHYLSHPSSSPPTPINSSRRVFVGAAATGLAAATPLALLARVENAQEPAVVSPPGSHDIARFNSLCTACHLCVSACPTHVLQPAFLQYGLAGLLQPRMDYHASFCNYDCKLCTEICPTGALSPLTQEAKHLTQLGIAEFIEELCIVHTDRTACGACAEHCPTKAVRMIPFVDNLTVPIVEEDICIGCGACEYACPVRPERAIIVKSNSVHALAQKPEVEQLQVEIEEDFPF